MGVGTTLKRWFGWFGIRDAPGCHCRRAACILDLRGADWCAVHQEKIIRWLRRSAQKRRIPFNETAARIVLRWAIEQAKTSNSVETL